MSFGSKFILDWEVLTIIDCLTYVGSLLTEDDRRALEASTSIFKVRAANSGPKHLRR